MRNPGSNAGVFVSDIERIATRALLSIKSFKTPMEDFTKRALKA